MVENWFEGAKRNYAPSLARSVASWRHRPSPDIIAQSALGSFDGVPLAALLPAPHALAARYATANLSP
jgi:hypothetical protein